MSATATATTPAAAEPLLEVEDLVVRFPVQRRQVIHAVEGVSFQIRQGEALGLVGESGSGKSTIGFTILRRYQPTAGKIHFEGRDVTDLKRNDLRDLRSRAQMIFQDPYSSLNPRMKVGDLVAEPLVVHGVAKKGTALRDRVGELLERCGLPASASAQYPSAFSGGQRQRIAIARALALGPKLIVSDEAVSALDVSIQAQVINLMLDLGEEKGISYLFISHDLAVVRQIATRVVILYAGKMMEAGETREIFSRPAHPYTRALLSAAPSANYEREQTRQRIVLSGEMPSVLEPPPGCRFSSRCPLAVDRCRTEAPPLKKISKNHETACWRWQDVASMRADDSA
jgi:oligopeptide/dipeptide ABC transporter ATP-binding protein